ncbi:hypothetical protein [Pseudomonas savastanoi]|uniref:Uncharacterized protein n=2 Tax=Pseudomonas savastanoi pv. glycinea TaxID=318 RepID=A0A0P9R1Y6_PSESG|nr:hypothetical protein [Pseudomonas savastanoi]EFW81817.1 hypothetical protein PsgB076_05128 [Pseudomonas savastanoi pv. glycinea str. B076]EFW83342.1 hypothetical protein PsgRace4_26356 [Pseudomonas savastanoi pv. glycinea str. race 4]EGH15760.1 hypothetical protein Pgy4_22007 [Pseudomonas savastanoi pv. glycinea str. race 4]KPX38996.1 hypothetical protein ALO37_100586 [Pseudomonas savastanoi pv. glycinea]MCQ3006472.1 hypothetical protein [Pseudomonas savastanoi]
MTYINAKPFLNVTPLGVRQKTTPLTITSTPGIFANVLQKTILKKEAPHTILRGGELRHKLMAQAENDPREASFLATQYAHNSLNGEAVDLSDYPVIRYCATGKVVTPESSAYFQKTEGWMHKERRALYEEEYLKGTPAAKILEKILNFNDALPKAFRDMANW